MLLLLGGLALLQNRHSVLRWLLGVALLPLLLGSSLLLCRWRRSLLCLLSRSLSWCRAAACQVKAVCEALWPHICP